MHPTGNGFQKLLQKLVLAMELGVTETTYGSFLSKWRKKKKLIRDHVYLVNKFTAPGKIAEIMERIWSASEIYSMPVYQKQRLNNITYLWNLKKLNMEKQGIEWWLPGQQKRRDVGQKAQTPSYMRSKFWGLGVQHRDYSYQYCIWEWLANRSHMSSPQKEMAIMWHGEDVKTVVVIAL